MGQGQGQDAEIEGGSPVIPSEAVGSCRLQVYCLWAAQWPVGQPGINICLENSRERAMTHATELANLTWIKMPT